MDDFPDLSEFTELDSGTTDGIRWHVMMTWWSINGYVELPDGHPWLTYDDLWEIPAEVHGRITYTRGRIIGFDTNHVNVDSPHKDAPGYGSLSQWDIGDGHMWTQEEVTEEVQNLARQAARA